MRVVHLPPMDPYPPLAWIWVPCCLSPVTRSLLALVQEGTSQNGNEIVMKILSTPCCLFPSCTPRLLGIEKVLPHGVRRPVQISWISMDYGIRGKKMGCWIVSEYFTAS